MRRDGMDFGIDVGTALVQPELMQSFSGHPEFCGPRIEHGGTAVFDELIVKVLPAELEIGSAVRVRTIAPLSFGFGDESQHHQRTPFFGRCIVKKRVGPRTQYFLSQRRRSVQVPADDLDLAGLQSLQQADKAVEAITSCRQSAMA